MSRSPRKTAKKSTKKSAKKADDQSAGRSAGKAAKTARGKWAEDASSQAVDSPQNPARGTAPETQSSKAKSSKTQLSETQPPKTQPSKTSPPGTRLPVEPAALAGLLGPYRITNGSDFRIGDHNPGDTGGLDLEKDHARDLLDRGVAALSAIQERLFANNRWSVLLVFQAMDAAGKDGTIKHVMSGINPQGCQVHAFKAPSSEELDHDFLWRTHQRLPERGRIGIFNRSYYEEVLVVRVHQEMLDRQNLPPRLVTKSIWDDRLRDIRHHERYLARNGMLILKFFLNVSKDEQKKRLLQRIDDPAKNWKFESKDVDERTYWKAYMHAYEEAIRATASNFAPWYVIPADNKWFTRLAVMGAVVTELSKLGVDFPKIDDADLHKLLGFRERLVAD
ncbi:polyphosphate kinase 2 family protein [Chelatococcus asaccharovorans]|uniref:PPK2 family polyphosphate:nucleotide phosphotransferase n=1 Tax=Chelatococcus asaccharovorans TaxID=28210 RepID=A0A2V3UGX1_9HYPH|nr:polyphosphate kinase 2 family protein [Chelatococcus asaccharovorans]MBS7703932.1 polyphosphate kinase 2 family protein [Chelatococcus asaccharovorans]PXW58096.1 PPK2 family polyphosphate:nucleotide phosphotransferase [Chelatococcus asaccharovorans]